MPKNKPYELHSSRALSRTSATFGLICAICASPAHFTLAAKFTYIPYTFSFKYFFMHLVQGTYPPSNASRASIERKFVLSRMYVHPAT
jgi:hypothetical protein